MEVQTVNDCFILTKDVSLQQRALHKLAKDSWDNLLIKDDECVLILRETEKLIAHRDRVLKHLSDTLEKLPKSLKSKLINAIYCLQQAYREAVIWEGRCKSGLPFTILNPKTAGEYFIDNFIDSYGHFDELKWVKCFVRDDNQSVEKRFILACFYCFEETIRKLWNTMKTRGQLLCEGRLPHIKSKYATDDLIVIWVYHLENKYNELIREGSPYDEGFCYSGLAEAIFKGHEYAARFLWNLSSENDKNKFLENPLFGILTDAAEGNHAGLVSFIYSLLKEEQKRKLISYTIEDAVHQSSTSSAPILCCLLQSQYYEPVLNEILKPPFPVPTNIYTWILISLSFEISEMEITRHKSIFKRLWSHLPKEKQKKVVQRGGFYIIKNFVKIKALDLLEMIIQSLSHSEKDRMLLEDYQKAGISALDDFCFGGDFDALRRYLLCFLIDCSPDDQKLSLRSDASSILDKFIKNDNFTDFSQAIPVSEQRALYKVIEELQDSLNVLHMLLEQV